MSGNSCRGQRIAILGATGHIAKALTHQFGREEQAELWLFARSPQRASDFLAGYGLAGKNIVVSGFDEFPHHRYHTIINGVGIGSPAKLVSDPLAVFRLTEQFDELILDYLKQHRDALYVSLSSGAAYGTDFSEPVSEHTRAKYHVNAITPSEYYGIAKLHSEAKHRALGDLNIVDLRVFGFFSRFQDLGDRFLLSELVSCLKKGEEFVTGPQDIMRDFVHPEDLAALVCRLMEQGRVNDVFDVYSAAPVRKFELMDHFASTGALKYRIEGGHVSVAATGTKSNYYSLNRRAEQIGYRPRYTSLHCITRETEAILSRQTN